MALFTSFFTSIKSHNADIIRKSRFFHVIDHCSSNVIIKNICEQEEIKSDREKYWLKQRQRLDNAATRRKSRSDRFKKMSNQLMNQMLDSHANFVRDQSYLIQIKHFHVSVSKRTLQRAFAARKSRVERYKMTRIKPLSQKNQQLRIAYEKEHKDHTVENFWQYIHFTNEAHFDPIQMFEQRILRETDTKYESKNLQTMSSMKEVKLHIAVFVSWHHKDALQFYNDEHNMPDIQIKKSRKSRKRKHDTKNEYRQRIAEWEITLSHDVNIKSQDNSMTQVYYTNRLLLVYIMRFMNVVFFMIDRAFCKKTMILVTTHDQQWTSYVLAKQATESSSSIILRNRLISTQQKEFEIFSSSV